MARTVVIWFIVVGSALVLPIVVRYARGGRAASIAVAFLAAGEVVGVLIRALVVIVGADTLVGPGNATAIPRALGTLLAFNIAFSAGLVLAGLAAEAARRPVKKDMPGTVHRVMVKSLSLRAVRAGALLAALPAAGLLVRSFLGGSNLLTDPYLEAYRASSSIGMGPISVLQYMLPAALLVYYARLQGQVGAIWWVVSSAFIADSLLNGNRSNLLSITLILLALEALRRPSRELIRLLPIAGMMGVVLFYAAWTVIFVRGRLLHEGGSFLEWSTQAVTTNPLVAGVGLLRSSFNGFDGLVSVVSASPAEFPYQVGRFWFESLTIVVPRALWPSKWVVGITQQFTRDVWGLGGSAGNFVTAAGALWLDAGIAGVYFGAFVLGLCTWFLPRIADRAFGSNQWLVHFSVALWAFFLARFSFAGGPHDILFLERLVLAATPVVLLARLAQPWRLLTSGKVSGRGWKHAERGCSGDERG